MYTIPLAAALAATLAAANPGPQPGATPTPPAAAKTTPEPEKKPTLAQLRAAEPASRQKMEPLLLEIAREYKTYTRVSDRANWAPTDCRIPTPEGVQRSVSKDDATHGQKLYFLYARDDSDYTRLSWIGIETSDAKPFAAAVGQVLVKESFAPIEIGADEKVPPPPKPDDDDPNRGLVRPREMPPEYTCDATGRVFHTGDPQGLFIMAKLADTEKDGTDQGWIYATISPDLKQVTALGRIESCMGCHTKASHDRLFGPKSLQEREARQEKKEQAQPKPAPGPEKR